MLRYEHIFLTLVLIQFSVDGSFFFFFLFVKDLFLIRSFLCFHLNSNIDEVGSANIVNRITYSLISIDLNTNRIRKKNVARTIQRNKCNRSFSLAITAKCQLSCHVNKTHRNH